MLVLVRSQDDFMSLLWTMGIFFKATILPKVGCIHAYGHCVFKVPTAICKPRNLQHKLCAVLDRWDISVNTLCRISF